MEYSSEIDLFQTEIDVCDAANLSGTCALMRLGILVGAR